MPELETWTTPSPDGTEIAVHTQGTGDPVVLVHGTACDHRVFARVGRRLATRFTVHAVDRRGRGASGDGPAYALEREAEDILAVCEAIREQAAARPALVGHSLGGIVSLEAAARTDAVDRLAVYEPPIQGDQRPSLDAVDELDALLKTQGREAVVEAFLAEVGYTPEEIDLLKRSKPHWEATLATAGTIPREARADLTYEIDPFALAQLALPVLLMVGDQSPPMFREAIDRLRANLPDARVEIIEDASHGVLYQAPGAFADLVAGFLDGQG